MQCKISAYHVHKLEKNKTKLLKFSTISANQINLYLFYGKKYDCRRCKLGLQNTTRWPMLHKL